MPTIADLRANNSWANDLTDEQLLGRFAEVNKLPLDYAAGYLGYQAPQSDLGKEFYAGGNRYLAGMGHIAGALGIDAGTEYAKRKESRAAALQAMSSAPHSWDEVKFGDADKGVLPYIGQLGAYSAPHMAEAITWGAADAATGGALTPALVARGAQALARSSLARGAVERGAASAIRETPTMGWKAAIDAGTNSVADTAARTAMVPLVTYPSSLGDVLSNQHEQAGTYDLGSAAALAVPYAGLNAAGLEGAAIRRGLPMREALSAVRSRPLRAAGYGGVTALGEGFNETGQEVANQYGRVAVDPSHNPWGDQALKQYKESFIGGAFLGGPTGTVGGALSKHSPRITRDQQTDLLNTGINNDYTALATQDQEFDNLRQYDAASEQLRRQGDREFATASEYDSLQQEADLLNYVRQQKQLGQMANANNAQYDEAMRQYENAQYDAAMRAMQEQRAAEDAQYAAEMQQLEAAAQGLSGRQDPWNAYQQGAVQYHPTSPQQLMVDGAVQSPQPYNYQGAVDYAPDPVQLTLGLDGRPGRSDVVNYQPAAEPEPSAPVLGPTGLFGPRGGVSPEADAARTQRRMLVREQARLSKVLGYTPTVNATPVIVEAEQALAERQIDKATFDQVVNASARSPKNAAAILARAKQPQPQGAVDGTPTTLDEASDQGQRVEPVGSVGAVPAVSEQPVGGSGSTGAPVGRRRKAKPVGDGASGQRVEEPAVVTEPEQVVEEAPQADAAQAEAKPAPAPKTEVVATGNTARDIVRSHDIQTDEGVTAALRDLMKNENVPYKIAATAEEAVDFIETSESDLERAEETAIARNWLRTVGEHRTQSERKQTTKGTVAEIPKVGSLAEQLGAKRVERAGEVYGVDKGWRDIHEALAGVKTLGEALEKLASLPYLKGWQKVLVRSLLKSEAVRTSTLTLNTDNYVASSNDPDAYALGHYDPENNAVFLHAGGGVQSLLHEAVHAAVFNKMEADAAFRKQIGNLYLQAKRALGEDHYGMTDLQEFVAEAFTNPEFQAALANIPSKNAPEQSLWTAFVDLIRAGLQLFGIQRSLLDDVITATAPNIEGAAGEYVGGSTAERAISASKASEFRIKWGENIKDVLRRGVLATIPLDQLVRMFEPGKNGAKSFGDYLRDYQKRMNEKGAAARKYIESVRPLGEKWTKLGSAEGAKLSNALTTATLQEAWGDVAFEHADNAHLRSTDPDLLAENRKAYNEARDAYNALTNEAKELYRPVLSIGSEWLKKEYTLRGRAARDAYLPLIQAQVDANTFSQLQDAYTNDKIGVADTRKAARALLKGNPKALELVKEMDAMIDEQIGRMREMQGPYFPLMRFGEYLTVYKSKEFSAKLDAYAAASQSIKQYRADNFAAYDEAVRELRDAQIEHRKRPTPANKAAMDTAKKTVADLKESLKDKQDELNKLKGANAKAFKELAQMATEEKHYIFEKHESSGAAKLRAEQLGQQFTEGDIVHMASADYLNDALPTSRAFVNKLEARFKQRFGDNTPQYRAAVAALNTTFLETTHDRSSLKRMFLQRKKVPGYSREGQRVFAIFAMQGAHRLSSIEHFVEMQTALDEAAKEAHRQDRTDSGRLTQVSNEVLRRFEIDMKYNETPVMDWITKLNHTWTLGVSPAYLLQNLSQTHMVSTPMIAARHGLGKSVNAVWKAWSDSYKIISDAVSKQGGRYTVDIDALNLSDGEKKMLKDLFHAGLADILQEHDIGEVASGNETALKVNKAIDKINWISRQIELHNRLTTSLAAYRLENARTNDQEAASRYAQNVVSDTQINYSDENASRWLKKNAFFGAKLLGQFKKYQIGMATTVAMNAKKAFAGDKEALRATLGILSTHLVMTGTMGLSLYFPAKVVISTLAGILGLAGDDDEPFDFDRWYKNWVADVFGKELGDVITRGIPTAVGLDFSGSLGQGNLFNPLPFYRGGDDTPKALWQAIAPPALGTMSNIYKGVNKMMEGEYVEGLALATPRYISAIPKAYKLDTVGITTKEGNVRIPAEQFDTADIVMQGLGLPLVDVRKYYERENDFFELRTNQTKVKSQLLKGWSETGERPDGVDRFNAKYPDARLTFKDVLAQRKKEKAYAKQVTDEGLRASKKQQTLVGEIRY